MTNGMHAITLSAQMEPGMWRLLLGPGLAHIPDEQIGPHFARCEQAGICPWAMAREQVERCDDKCGAVSGCRLSHTGRTMRA